MSRGSTRSIRGGTKWGRDRTGLGRSDALSFTPLFFHGASSLYSQYNLS